MAIHRSNVNFNTQSLKNLWLWGAFSSSLVCPAHRASLVRSSRKISAVVILRLTWHKGAIFLIAPPTQLLKIEYFMLLDTFYILFPDVQAWCTGFRSEALLCPMWSDDSFHPLSCLENLAQHTEELCTGFFGLAQIALLSFQGEKLSSFGQGFSPLQKIWS